MIPRMKKNVNSLNWTGQRQLLEEVWKVSLRRLAVWLCYQTMGVQHARFVVASQLATVI